MPSFQYRDLHYINKASCPSYLYDGNPIHGKTVFVLKWDSGVTRNHLMSITRLSGETRRYITRCVITLFVWPCFHTHTWWFCYWVGISYTGNKNGMHTELEYKTTNQWLAQDCSISIANALGILQSYTKPSANHISAKCSGKSASHLEEIEASDTMHE